MIRPSASGLPAPTAKKGWPRRKRARTSLYGKTATGYSQKHLRVEGHHLIPNLAGFAGLAPVDNPRIVVYVGVENPTDKKWALGSFHAAPVFKEVAEKTLAYLKVPPTKE